MRRRHDLDGASVGADAAVLRERLRRDKRRCVLADMDHTRAGVEVLSLSCKCNACVLAVSALSLEDGRRIEIGHMGAERAGNPLHAASLLDECALRIEVIHVLRPVLDGRVAETCIFLHIELDAARVEVCDVPLRC